MDPTDLAIDLDREAPPSSPPQRVAPVTVVVVTYNSAGPIARLLPTLDDGLAGVPRWRLVVVDNASADDTVATVRRLRPGTEVVEMGRNAGYAAAINAGAALAGADDVLLVLNPDTRLRHGCVARLLATLATAHDGRPTGIAVPRLMDPGTGRTAPSLRRDPSVRTAWAEALLGGHRAARLGMSEVVRDPARYETTTTADWATGAALAIAPDCRRDVGAWDESFFLYSEEVDYCRRARDAGYVIRYCPDAVAEHVGGPYGENLALWRLVVRNRIVHFARHSGTLRAQAFRAGVVVNQALRAPRDPAARVGLVTALGTSVRAARAGRIAPPQVPTPDAASTPDAAPTGAPENAPAEGRARPFIWFAAQDWWYHNRAHSDFQLMRQVARERPVLVVNSLGLRLPRPGVSSNPGRRILRKLRSMAKLVRRPVPDLPGFHVMTPLMVPAYGSGALARLNAWIVRQQVRVVAAAIGVGRRPTIALTIPTAWPVVRPMRRAALLFNRSDLHSAFPEADGTWVAHLEDELLRHADRVLYVSHELMRLDAEVVGERGVFLGHGVDLDHFDPDVRDDEPPELAAIPRPRMGFFGGLNGYNTDLPLLAETARALPDVSLVLIGDANSPIDDLLALPNVHWLGRQPYERIPAFGRGFDVALMPWLDNEWIRFANPIKLREYLALGLPVVTTDYPEIRHDPAPVLVARSRVEFPALVRAALAEPGDPQARRAAVLEMSWEARARALLRIAVEAAGG